MDVEQLVARLVDRGYTLSVAESCTGGLIGGAITAVSGSSKTFRGGVIAYSNEVKQQLLHVPAELLRTLGAVSAEVVQAMAKGVRESLGTDCSIAVSGIAGPGGGSSTKPVGLVFIGIATPQATQSYEYRFSGNREEVRRQAVAEGLRRLEELVE